MPGHQNRLLNLEMAFVGKKTAWHRQIQTLQITEEGLWAFSRELGICQLFFAASSFTGSISTVSSEDSSPQPFGLTSQNHATSLGHHFTWQLTPNIKLLIHISKSCYPAFSLFIPSSSPPSGGVWRIFFRGGVLNSVFILLLLPSLSLSHSWQTQLPTNDYSITIMTTKFSWKLFTGRLRQSCTHNQSDIINDNIVITRLEKALLLLNVLIKISHTRHAQVFKVIQNGAW